MPPIQKVTPGSPLAGSPLRKASFVNDVVDATNFVKAQFLGGGGMPAPVGILTDCVTVRNDTGAARQRGACVQLGNYLLNPINHLALWFEGRTPSQPFGQRYAILRDPIPQGEFGFAQIGGACLARVNVGSTAHRFATPIASHMLASGASGPIELLQVPTAAGEQELVVRLAAPSTAPLSALRFTITAAASLQATVDKSSDTSKYPQGSTQTLANPHGWTIEDGMTGEAVDHGDGVPEIISITCPVDA